LAFPSLSAYGTGATPVFQTLAAQGSFTTDSFGVYLAHTYSELYLGGTNNEFYKGDFTYVPLTKEVRLCRVVPRFDVNNNTVTSQGYWQINIDALYVNGQRVTGVTDSVVDTGTTLILGDNKTVQAIYNHIPGSAHATRPGYYTSTEIGQLSLVYRKIN